MTVEKGDGGSIVYLVATRLWLRPRRLSFQLDTMTDALVALWVSL